ncbi:MAG: ImmA/IrrE family metallo-endopeptidase [Pseudoxanthomonas sp.]|nr:MAG: ImmA/IrrE family metallo-endopeptidase [Pseudoxanthomonas sp.]
MDSLRRRTIEAKTEELLRDAGVTSLPIDPKQLAEHLGIQVTAKPPSIQGASGWLLRQGDEFGIVYATHIESIGFQHFSIAHELGHYLLDGHPEHVFRNSGEHASRAGFEATDEVEREADYFAACVLMPKQPCKPLINSSRDGMAAVLHLADQCRTSLTAAALRYAEIGQLPIGVVQSYLGKVEFCAAYPMQAHVGWARALMRNAKVPAASATNRLSHDRDAILQGREDSESCDAGDWFPGADRNIGLIEEAIGLGKFGRTLTVLTLDPETAKDEEEDDDRWEEPRFR